MVDEETQDVAAKRAGAPVNRDARPDPGVIEGEIAARGARRRRAVAGRDRSGGSNFGRRRPQSLSALALVLSRPARSRG